MSIDAVFWWIGAAICYTVAAAWALGVLLLLLTYLRGIALSVDWRVWIIKCGRLNGIKVKWRHLPKSFIKRVQYMPGNPDTTYTAIGGKWRGFRDWTAVREDGDQ